MNNEKKSNSIVNYMIVFFVGCLAMYAVIYFFPTTITENITKLEKDVTVTDTGIADAVEKVYDAVVVVSTYKDDKLYASGTGFVYKKDGNKYYILTNHHVIEKGNKVSVTFTDGKVLDTTVVGSDQYADIAVLSLESKDEIKLVEIGSSKDVRVGDTSFAVGAPLDSAYSWTTTRGIVSGKDRLVEVAIGNSQTSDYVMKVLQTDASINSGNSGGPLCNSNGEVIGITSLKLVSEGVEGIGFAIPIEDALETAKRLMDDEKISYPYLGIEYIDISSVYSSMQWYRMYSKLVADSGLTEGVIVYSVEKGSPVDDAGVKADDIIVSFEGEKVPNMAYLKYYLYQHKSGDNVTITIYRNGKYQDIKIKLGSNKQQTT